MTSLPPLPMSGSPGPHGMGSSDSVRGSSSSAFSGGLPGMMQSIQQIEAGVQTLASQLPSLAPLLAEFVSKLRLAVPSAIGAGAGQQSPGAQDGNIPGGQQGLPSPPM